MTIDDIHQRHCERLPLHRLCGRRYAILGFTMRERECSCTPTPRESRIANHVSLWLEADNLCILVSRTKCIPVSCRGNQEKMLTEKQTTPAKRNKTLLPRVAIGDGDIEANSCSKCLGVIQDPDITFNGHVSHICSELSGSVGIRTKVKARIMKKK